MESLHGQITQDITLCSGASIEGNNFSGLNVCDPLILCAIHDQQSYQNVLFSNNATSQFIGFNITISNVNGIKGNSVFTSSENISEDNTKINYTYNPSQSDLGNCIYISLCWNYLVTYPTETCTEEVRATYKLCFDGEVLQNVKISNEEGSDLEAKICTEEEGNIKFAISDINLSDYKITPYVSIDGGSFQDASFLGLQFIGTPCYETESGEIINAICGATSSPISVESIDINTSSGSENILSQTTNLNQLLPVLNSNSLGIIFYCEDGKLKSNQEIISITLNTSPTSSFDLTFSECEENSICYLLNKQRLIPDREYCFKFIYTVNEVDDQNTNLCDDLKINIDVSIENTNTTENQLLIDYGFSSISQSDIVSATISAGTQIYNLLVSGDFTHNQSTALTTFDGFISVQLTNGCLYEQVFSITIGTSETLVIVGM